MAGASVREIDQLPGPAPLALLGHASAAAQRSMHLVLEQWQREYGDAFRVWLPGFGKVPVFAASETVHAILRDRPDGWRRHERIAEIADDMRFAGLFSAEGEAWRRQRALVMQALDARHIEAFLPVLAGVADRLVARWRRAADAGAASRLDAQADLMRFTVDATTSLAFGVDVNTIENDHDPVQRDLGQVFPMLMRRLDAPLPWWRWIRLPSDRRFDRALARVHALVDDLVARARARLAAGDAAGSAPGDAAGGASGGAGARPRDLLEALVLARDADGRLSDEQVVGNVLTILLAGEDTTANTIAWMLHYLACDPALQASVRAEALAAVPAGGPAGLADLERMPLLDAVAHETLRLRPPGPVFYLSPNADRVVDGVRVPRGRLTMLLTRPAALDAARFAEPRAFLPQRWAGEPRPGHEPRASIPFGAGPRVCPGRRLAVTEIRVLVAAVLRAFEVLPAGDEPTETLAFAMMPSGLRVGLRPIEAAADGAAPAPASADAAA